MFELSSPRNDDDDDLDDDHEQPRRPRVDPLPKPYRKKVRSTSSQPPARSFGQLLFPFFLCFFSVFLLFLFSLVSPLSLFSLFCFRFLYLFLLVTKVLDTYRD